MCMLFLILLYILSYSLNGYAENIKVNAKTNIIDVVIPCTDKDLQTLPLCIDGIRKNGKGVRRIIVISDKKLTDKAEWFDEKNFEFSKFDVAYEIFQNKEKAFAYINHKNSRIGWLYQQLLKLYAPLTIPNISSNVLILDSDTIFLKPYFFDNEGRVLYNLGSICEYNGEYFEHMKRLLPTLRRVYPKVI